MDHAALTRETALAILRTNWPRLQNEFHVRQLLLFGSLARDASRPESDVDLLVEFDKPTGYFGLVKLQLCLQDLLRCEIDLATLQSLREAVRSRIQKEAIRVA